MAFPRAAACVFASAVVSALGSFPARAQGPDVGVEVQAGRVSVSSKNDIDIDKSGSAYAGDLFFRNHLWIGSYQLGLGLQSSHVAGDDPSRGVKNQTVKVQAPFLDARYLFALPMNFDLGLSIRNYVGKGANYDSLKVDQLSDLLALGPVVGYTQRFGQWSVGLTASYYYDLNAGTRRVGTLLAGLSVAYQLSGKGAAVDEAPVSKAAPSPPAQEAPPPPPAPKAPPPDLQVNLGTRLLTFDFGSAQIKPESQARITYLAQALAQHRAIIGHLTVAGHTDNVGPIWVNDRLSLARARAVCAEFVEAGVGADQLTCEGRANREPLAGVPLDSADQRRVELAFNGIESSVAEQLGKIIAEALKH